MQVFEITQNQLEIGKISRKILSFLNDRSISTRSCKKESWILIVHESHSFKGSMKEEEEGWLEGIRGIQSRETRCVPVKVWKQKEKSPSSSSSSSSSSPFSSFSVATISPRARPTIRQKEFLISGERKLQGMETRGRGGRGGFQPGYARTSSNKILPQLNAPLNFAFRLPSRLAFRAKRILALSPTVSLLFLFP